jgi:DNA-binding response OmpR family regulator
MSKIVVVDDDRVTVALLEKALSSADVQILSAPNGQIGLSLISGERPEVVIIDLLIPQIDGFELCRWIRNSPDLKETKIIIMSAIYKGVYFKRDISDSGADAFLAKPLNMQELRAKVASFLKKDGNPSPQES